MVWQPTITNVMIFCRFPTTRGGGPPGFVGAAGGVGPLAWCSSLGQAAVAWQKWWVETQGSTCFLFFWYVYIYIYFVIFFFGTIFFSTGSNMNYMLFLMNPKTWPSQKTSQPFSPSFFGVARAAFLDRRFLRHSEEAEGLVASWRFSSDPGRFSPSPCLYEESSFEVMPGVER